MEWADFGGGGGAHVGIEVLVRKFTGGNNVALCNLRAIVWEARRELCDMHVADGLRRLPVAD